MKNKIIIPILIAAFALTACGNSNNDTKQLNDSSNAVEGTDVPETVYHEQETVKDYADGIPLGETFNEPTSDGESSLKYTVTGSHVYDNVNDAGIDVSKLYFPSNLYGDMDMMSDYLELSDYYNSEDGSVKSDFEFVVVDMHIENIDAVGMIKKDEFSVSNMALIGSSGDSDADTYVNAYFSESGKVDSEQKDYFKLSQGESIDVQLGYFVLKADDDNLMGFYMANNGLQYCIR